MSEVEKLSENNTTTSSRYSVSSDESSLVVKQDEHVPMNDQQLPKRVSCPVAASDIEKPSSSTVSAQNDALPVPSAAVWPKNYCQELTALPAPSAPIRLKTVSQIRSVSPNLPTPLTYERLATHAAAASAVQQMLDEPLNLSKNSLMGPGVIINAKVQRKPDDAYSSVFNAPRTPPKESSVASNPSAQPLHAHSLNADIPVAHFNQPLGTSPHLKQPKARKLNCPSPLKTDSGCTITPKVGAGNFSSLKLPPGLIIERVEYKQSRPSITKEVPSVTIVARQRQLPAPELMPSVALRSGPCPENRISVTITESSSTAHERVQDTQVPSTSVDLSTTTPQRDKVVPSYCSPSPMDLMPIRAPQRMACSATASSLYKPSTDAAGHAPGTSVKTPPPMTTLIIPQVPMPPLASQTVHPLKRARRKSVFVPLPVVPIDESNREVMAKTLRQQHPIIPTIVSTPSPLSSTAGSLTSANLLASMSLSFIAPSLLPVPGTSMLSPIDMQRLATVRLPAHLQPPVIPPLKIPDPATSASLLEKMFHPTPSDVLSTGLELKPDAQGTQPKQPSVAQPTAIRSHMYSNTAEENSPFISSKPANLNGTYYQTKHASNYKNI
uniref:Uncharacterized protein n=1 Tax=Anopheles maculatus TaxID=74869 RepID=A0A182S8N6_9DIPT